MARCASNNYRSVVYVMVRPLTFVAMVMGSSRDLAKLSSGPWETGVRVQQLTDSPAQDSYTYMSHTEQYAVLCIRTATNASSLPLN